MELEKIITYGITGLAVGLTVIYLNKGANQEISRKANGEIELRMHRLYQILGFISIALALIFVIVALFYQEKEMYLIGLAMVLLFGGLGIPCLMYYQNHKLKFNDEKIVVQSWKKKVEEIKWTEINEIKFNPFTGYLKIKGFNKELTIHQHVVGLKVLVRKMEEKTKWRASELKLPIS